MRPLLALFSYLAFGLALPFLLGHPKLRRGVRARLGLYPEGWPQVGPGPRLWVHGASAGDILALLPTVRALRAAQPDLQVVATTITNSGRAMAARESALFAAVGYSPYDLPGATRRAMRRIRPQVLVLEYTELWPHLIHAARGAAAEVVLHNGRLASDRLQRYRLLFALTGNLLRPLRLLLMRDGHEADRALRLGAPPGRVHITGNTKFDNLGGGPAPAEVQAVRRVLGFAADAAIWVAGSTHEGEEDLLLGVYQHLRRSHPALKLVLAPRYTERGERLVLLARRRRLRARLRSATVEFPADGAADVLVLDTIGELSACYALATLVFVGGSFVPRGGQNILEPAACGKPVLFGPHMQNFADSVQVLLGRGGIQVASPGQLGRVLEDLLAREAHCRELGAMARRQVTAVRGAAGRNAALIGELLGASDGRGRRQGQATM